MSTPRAVASSVDDCRDGLIPISNSRRWAIIGLLFVASFINYLDRATISVAMPVISLDLHLGPETKGLVLSAFFWSYALLQIPVGWCTDRLNLRWLYAAHFAFWSLACGFMGSARGLVALLFMRAMLGIGESIYLAGGTKIVGIMFSSQERGFPSGVFDSGTRAGMAVGAPLVAMLIVHCGWHRMFALVGFTALFWLLPWLIVAPRNLQGVWNGSAALSPSGSRQVRIHFNRKLFGICLGFFCFDYYWYLLVTWLPDYLVTVRHLTVMGAGFCAALPFLVYGICEPIGGWLTDWFIRRGHDETRTRKTVLTVAFLCGLLLIGVCRARTTTTALVFLSGASFVGLSTGNIFAILQCCAPPSEVGVWTGIENLVGNVGGILAPLATGFLVARTGSYAPGFVFAAVLLVSGLLAYWFIVGELKPPDEVPF